METEKKLELVKQVGEEIVTEEELKQLLDTKKHPIAYDGFEPSGHLHIAQGIVEPVDIHIICFYVNQVVLFGVIDNFIFQLSGTRRALIFEMKVVMNVGLHLGKSTIQV